MKPSDEKGFKALRMRYLDQISVKKGEIKAIEAKLNVLGELENEVSASSELPLIDGQSQRYAQMGLSEAAIDALQSLAKQNTNARFSRAEVGNFMRENGFVPNGKHFFASVDTSLRRAVEKGTVRTSVDNGRRLYFVGS